MTRRFNTAGPCRPDIHYMLPAAARLPGVADLVEGQCYFVVHAPRQSGKTTTILALARELTASGRYASAVLSVEPGAPYETSDQAEPRILQSWLEQAVHQLDGALAPPAWPIEGPNARFGHALHTWARACPLPLVLFLDEVDGLAPEVLSSVLKQIRGNFPGRPTTFPHALALVGLRDVRDYVLVSGGSGRGGAGSPFNISAESLTLPEFSRADIAALYKQHTDDTGQAFSESAISAVHECTAGQPWLVNALAREAIKANPTGPIETEGISVARETLIVRRDTHLDSLAERLRDPRVRGVIEPILSGGFATESRDEDIRYVIELGLVRLGKGGALEFSNSIYREVIPRVLADTPRQMMPEFRPTWLSSAGQIEPHALMSAFVAFWRLNGRAMMRTIEYHEVAPQLVLMAFLHRVVNGGGTIDREFAVGSGRIDLCVRAPGLVMALELKVWRDGAADPLHAGLIQLDAYLERLGLNIGWLVIFDRRSARRQPTADDAGEVVSSPAGRQVHVVRPD